jgi:hypothetical protein
LVPHKQIAADRRFSQLRNIFAIQVLQLTFL